MLPKLAWNAGIVSLAAGLTLAATTTAARNPVHNIYPLTVSKNSSGAFVLADKLPTYRLDFHGSVTWNVENLSGEEIEVALTDFEHSGPRKCPVEFTHNSGNTASCASTRRIKDQQSKFVRVARGDTDPDASESFDFAIKINGTIIDPEIEIDREPGGRLNWWKWLFLISGGILSTFGGWRLLRRR